MSKHKSTIKTTIRLICPMEFSKTLVWKVFCKLLSKHLWWSLFWVKFHIFLNAFRRMRPNMRSIYWDVYYLRNSNKHSGSCLKLQKLHKDFWWKYIENENHKSYSGNKGQRVKFPVVSRWGAFCTPLFLRAWSDTKLKPKSRKIGRNEIKFV